MKKMLFLASFLGVLVSGQIGIGNNVTTFDDSEVLKIVSNNKGVLIPNVSIPNLANASPVNSPATSLLVYNTNTTTGKGFHFWKNNKWNILLDSSNIFKYLGVINSTTVVSDDGVNDSSTNGGVTYNIGEIPSAHQWQLIPNVTSTINVYSPTNNVTINASGLVQVQRSGTGTSLNSYAIAVFIDGKLAAVRNYTINATSTCTYNDFNIMMVTSNLTPGSHTVSLYETYRADINNVGPTLRFGDKISTCSNLTSDMARTVMNIQISEKP